VLFLAVLFLAALFLAALSLAAGKLARLRSGRRDGGTQFLLSRRYRDRQSPKEAD